MDAAAAAALAANDDNAATSEDGSSNDPNATPAGALRTTRQASAAVRAALAAGMAAGKVGAPLAAATLRDFWLSQDLPQVLTSPETNHPRSPSRSARASGASAVVSPEGDGLVTGEGETCATGEGNEGDEIEAGRGELNVSANGLDASSFRDERVPSTAIDYHAMVAAAASPDAMRNLKTAREVLLFADAVQRAAVPSHIKTPSVENVRSSNGSDNANGNAPTSPAGAPSSEQQPQHENNSNGRTSVVSPGSGDATAATRNTTGYGTPSTGPRLTKRDLLLAADQHQASFSPTHTHSASSLPTDHDAATSTTTSGETGAPASGDSTSLTTPSRPSAAAPFSFASTLAPPSPGGTPAAPPSAAEVSHMAMAEARRRFPAYSDEQAALVAAMLLEDAAQQMNSPQKMESVRNDDAAAEEKEAATAAAAALETTEANTKKSRPKSSGGRQI
jgi:hypothetical protein